ncbi:MAG: glycosyltransferase family 4 protein [Bacteroidales bacterium]|nr:glycosyltransferase family 4 protein [Bacteroidales bacterium]
MKQANSEMINKIYFVENENPLRNSTGGIMSYLIALSKYLIHKGIECTLIGTGKDNIEQNVFSNFYSIIKLSNPNNFKFLLSLLIKIPFFKIDKFSIIHSQRPDMLVPFFLFKSKRIKTIVTLHGRHNISIKDNKSKWQYLIYIIMQKYSFKKADHIIAVSKQTMDYYVNLYPFIKDKISVIPTGIDFLTIIPVDFFIAKKKFGIPLDTKVILYLGRIDYEKNLTLLIDAYKNVKEKITDLWLIIAGFGAEEEKLKQKLRIEKIKDVIFIGEIDHSEISALFSASNVFGFTSLYEGSPIVIKEALACNLPVVSTDVGDVKEVLADFEGCYISDYNANHFAEKLLSAIKFKNNNYREKIIKYNYINIAEETLKIYKRVCAE